MKHFLALAFAGTLLLSGCGITGEEIGRLNLYASPDPSGNYTQQSIDLNVEADTKVWLWSQVDMKWKGNMGLFYEVEIVQDSAVVQQFMIDPHDKDVTLNAVELSTGNSHSAKFTGRNTFVRFAEAGTYTMRCRLLSDGNPTYEIKKADIIFKE